MLKIERLTQLIETEEKCIREVELILIQLPIEDTAVIRTIIAHYLNTLKQEILSNRYYLTLLKVDVTPTNSKIKTELEQNFDFLMRRSVAVLDIEFYYTLKRRYPIQNDIKESP